MAGYTRQSTFTDGDVITAAHSNDEFDQVLAAFNNTSGHAHDGTAAEGPVIGLIGDAGLATPLNKIVVDTTNDQIEFNIDVSGTSTEQLVIKDGVIEPTTDDDIDLGSSGKQFKDLYIDGTANLDSVDIDGGTIDGVTIGGVTAAAGSFTTVNSSGAMIATGGFQGTLTGAVIGNVTGNVTGDVTGNADTATALATARNFSLTGDVTATAVSFDGSGNVALNGSLAAGVVDTVELATDAVTTAKITDSNVTNAKLANSSVTINTNSLSLGGTLTLDSDDIGEGSSNLYFTDERVDDRVNGLLTAGSNITLTYNDAANTLTIAATEDDLSNNDTDDLSEGSTNLYFTNERVDDRVNGLLTAGSNITLTYDDAANSLTIAATEDDLSNNDTDDLSEGSTNLYFTNTRADARITAAVGSTVQGYDAQLADIAGLTPTDGNFIVGDGANFVLESGATARTSLGLGTAATQAVGTSANNVVQLDGSSRLPAVDGSQLTNLPASGDGGIAMAIALG